MNSVVSIRGSRRVLRQNELRKVLDADGPLTLPELRTHRVTGYWPGPQLELAVGDLLVAGELAVLADDALALTAKGRAAA